MILLVSGSLRAMSTNTALLRTAAALSSSFGAVLYDGVGLLPHFDPDDDVEPLHPEVRRLRGTIAAADALVMSTPEYAGALPGSFKNLLDWTVGGVEMDRKPVAIVNVSAVGADKAAASLRTVLGYVQAQIVEEATVRIPVLRQHVGPDGLIDDPAIRAQLTEVLTVLGRLPPTSSST